MMSLCFYVPEDHLEEVKTAVFEAGGGHVGDYAQCCWQIQGEGQFVPLAGSDPAIGGHGELSTVMEYRVELLCADGCIGEVVRALHDTHPYETPAFHVTPCLDIPPGSC